MGRRVSTVVCFGFERRTKIGEGVVSIGCTRDWIGSKVDARHCWTRNLHFCQILIKNSRLGDVVNWYPHVVNFVFPILRLKIWLLVVVGKAFLCFIWLGWGFLEWNGHYWLKSRISVVQMNIKPDCEGCLMFPRLWELPACFVMFGLEGLSP